MMPPGLLIGIIAVALIAELCAAYNFTRPSVVHWAFLADSDDTSLAESGLQHWYGLKSAEKYINENNLLKGTNVSFDFVPSLTFTGANLANATAAIANATAGGYMGFVLPDWVSSDYVMAGVKGKNIPVVAPQTTSSGVFNSSYRNALFLRQPFSTEYIGALNYGVNSVASCGNLALVYVEYEGFDSIIKNVVISANYLGIEHVKLVSMTAEEGMSPNMSSFLPGRFFNTSTLPVNPRCVYLIGLGFQVLVMVETLWGDSRLNRNETFFFAASSADALFFNSLKYGTAPFVNFRVVHTLASPTNSSIGSVAFFMKQYDAFVATNPISPSRLSASLPPPVAAEIGLTGKYTYSTMEGFNTAMFIAEVLKGMLDFTAAEFLNTVYTRKYFTLHERVFGPFTDECLNSTVLSFPCFCNTGGRSYYMTQVNLSTGHLIPAVRDLMVDDSSTLTLTAGLQVCSLSLSNVIYPLNLAMIFDPSVTGLEYKSMYQFAATMVASSVYVNELGVIASQGRFNPVLRTDFSVGATDAPSYLTTFADEYSPFVMIGGVVPTGNSGIPSLFQNALNNEDSDAELIAATRYSHFDLKFTPVLADYIHSLSFYMTQTLGATIAANIYCIYETLPLYKLMVKSLNTFQVDGKNFIDISAGDNTTLQNSVRAAIDSASQGIKTYIVISMKTTAFMIWTVQFAQLATLKLTTAKTQQALTVLFALDHRLLFYVKGQGLAAGIPSGITMVFASVASEWWVPSSIIYQGLRSVRTDIPSTSYVFEYPAVVSGFLASTLLYSIIQLISDIPTSENLISTLYDSTTVSSFGVSYGPFYSVNCSADVIASKKVDRTCQCYKGPRKFHILSFNDWLLGTSGATQGAFYSMSTCGVAYLPLAVTTDYTTLIIGVSVGVGGGLLILFGSLIYLAVKPKRDNRAAPKDSNEPFAMVFTDIQSSTSLWARCPQQMGLCVEKHHDDIRVLVKKFEGYEVKTIGDSFMVAFKKATNAVDFALAIQTTFYDATWPPEVDDTYRSLAREAAEDMLNEGKELPPSRMQYENDVTYTQNWNGIRVRVGLHWGVGSVKFDPVSQGYDYYGTLVNTAARVEGVGNGGQVLVTKDMFDELERAAFNFKEVDIVPLGPQPLRGLDAPVPLYQLNPQKLKTRLFNELRLDIENAAEEASDSTEVADNVSQRSSNMNNATEPHEAVAEKIVRQKRANPFVVDQIMSLVGLFQLALSTSTDSWQHETVTHLTKKWHIHLRKILPHEKKDHYFLFILTSFCGQLYFTNEEAKKTTGLNSNQGTNTKSFQRPSINLPHTPQLISGAASAASFATPTLTPA